MPYTLAGQHYPLLIQTMAGGNKKRATAVQGLADLLDNSPGGTTCHNIDFGMDLPFEFECELVDFIRGALRKNYLWNDLSTITALPAPLSWLNKLQEFAETFGGKKQHEKASEVPLFDPHDGILFYKKKAYSLEANDAMC